MPDTLYLSTGVSLGLLAGIVSGVCYIVTNGLTWPKNESPRGRLTSGAAPAQDICDQCGGDTRGGVIPCICHQHRPVKFESGAWFLRQVQRAISLMPWTISTDKLEQIEEECEGNDSPSPEAGRELRSVREFLEALSAKLAGGTLEGTRVAPLYDHPAYLPPRAEAPDSGASGAHAQLKRLVARVVEEAAALPALARYAAEPARTPPAGSTYEDLLATAILNKVIERYQTEGSGGRSSGIHSASASPSPSDRSSPRGLHSRNRDITPPLHEEDEVSDWEEGATEDALELPRRAPFPDFSEEIDQHTENDTRDFDEVSGSEIHSVDGTWEENWLFQKKKIKTLQSVPVPMLVPNSNAEYRVLIGDRDADDTTDLSDNASDVEEEEINYKSDIKRVLDSKHVIGGKSKVDEAFDFEPDSLTILDESDDFEKIDESGYVHNKLVDVINNEIKGYTNGETNGHINGKAEDSDDSILIVGVDSGPLTKAEFVLKEEIHRTLLNGANDYVEDLMTKEKEGFRSNTNSLTSNKVSGPNSTLSRHEREGEYEETVTLPVQRYADSLRRKHFDDEPQQIPTRDTDHEDELIPGSIAYRERKKWLNYVEMPNNPYSPEAIQKRLLTKSTSSLFDSFTSKSKTDEESNSGDIVDGKEPEKKEPPVNEIAKKPSLSLSVDNVNVSRSTSPSPKILKDVLAEEIPQYKRYGRDYYIKEAKSCTGSRKKVFSDTSSMSSMNKSTSLDNFDVEFASPVSACSSLSDLEASALHQNIVRAVLSPRNASPNFAINPIFENPDRQNDNADENATDERIGRTNVRQSSVCNGGDGYVENEDIVRLKIPIKPEVTEDLFETYTNVRRSNTLRSEDLCVRAKRRPGLNYTFGGSLRLSKGFHTDLCIITTVIYKTLVGLLIKQFNTIASNQQYTKFVGKEKKSFTTLPRSDSKKDILIEYEDVTEHTLFSAKPVYIDDDTDKKFEEILQSACTTIQPLSVTINSPNEEPQKSPGNLSADHSYLSTSSLEDSIKIYNVQTGEIVKCKPEDNVSERYETVGDRNDNTDTIDKNAGETDRLSPSDSIEDFVIIEENSDEETLENISELDDILAQLPKVKELAKKFVSMENLSEPVKPQHPPRRRKSKDNILNGEKQNKLVYMHSLTARSISREFREELKLSMATPLKVPGGSKDIPEGTEDVTKESSRPGSPLPEPGTLKTKLAFFESLKSKFSK